MALYNLNILNINLILFADNISYRYRLYPTSVIISEPSNTTLYESLNLVILNLHEWFDILINYYLINMHILLMVYHLFN